MNTCNIFMRGSTSAGKTSLLYKFAKNFFFDDWEPTIDDSLKHVFDVDGVKVESDIFDLNGDNILLF